MTTTKPRVLIAAPNAVIRQLGSVLADSTEVIGAQTWEQALEQLARQWPDLIIVCYAFDQRHPFRLLQHLRHERPAGHVPTMLVRALPVRLGKSQEQQIRESYRTLGVDEFLNLHHLGERDGEQTALLRLRESVLSRLPVIPEA